MIYDYVVIGSGFGGSVTGLRLVVAAGALGTLELLLKQKYRYNTLSSLSDKLGFELRTNAETLCAVSGGFLKTVFNFSWSTKTVIFLVMQSADNAMKMIWKKNLFGGKMKIDNSPLLLIFLEDVRCQKLLKQVLWIRT